jgi:hypothetical protein
MHPVIVAIGHFEENLLAVPSEKCHSRHRLAGEILIIHPASANLENPDVGRPIIGSGCHATDPNETASIVVFSGGRAIEEIAIADIPDNLFSVDHTVAIGDSHVRK